MVKVVYRTLLTILAKVATVQMNFFKVEVDKNLPSDYHVTGEIKWRMVGFTMGGGRKPTISTTGKKNLISS